MKPKQIEKWEKTRQMGPWKYALIYGTVWGFFVAAFVFIANYLSGVDESKNNIISILLMLLVYWVTGIILYRFIFWRAKERVYQSWKKTQEPD
jgi:cobalamin synthase